MVKVNAYMRVTIRVVNQGATQQLAQIRSQLNGIQTAARGAGNGVNSIFSGNAAANMEKFGKNLQWTGRQLEYRFTLPLVAAGIAAGKFALDNEAAITRVRKVYGGINKPVSDVNAEVTALSKTFRVLSDMFGVNQKEVIEVAAAWAQAGSSGAGLAKQTRLTLEAMILGEIASEDATRGLIAIQAQYSLSAAGLKDALAVLNVVENETAISTGELISGFERSAGAARTAGIDVRHLAALMAALVPATGSAENAGNALKTIMSRLMAPTSDMNELFGLLGINISTMAWQSKNGAERLLAVAEATDKLTAPQQAVVGAIMASRFQVSKFDVLMRDILDPLGNYNRALQSTADIEKVRTQYTKEIGIQLASQPQQVKILWTQIKNMATQAIVPLIPYLIMFLRKLVELSHWFTGLSPTIRKTALAGLFFLAVLGPILAYAGAFIVLGAQLWKMFSALGTGLGLLGKGFEKIFGKSFLSVAGAAGRGFGQMLGLASRGFGALVRLSAAGGKALINSNAAAWLGRLLVEAAGWVQLRVLYVAGWLDRIVTEAAAWVRLRFATLTGWLTRLAIEVAGWVSLRTGYIFGWASLLAIELAGWLRLRLMYVAGWASLLAIQAAGWIASAIGAAIGSAAVALAAIGWVPLLIAAVVIAMLIFNKQIAAGLRSAAGWFAKLPGVVNKVFISLINMVKSFGQAFTKMLHNALNPFQRHSPSLVDLVTAGVDLIAKKYASLRDVGRVFRQAADDVKAFRAATEGSRKESEGGTFTKQREDILTVSPDAGPQIDSLLSSIRALEAVLEDIGAEYIRQNAIVMQWAAALKIANAEVDKQTKLLDQLKETADGLADELSAAKARLADLADTPIEGMKAIGDQLFANEMAQKRLRLEMLRLGDAADTVDDLKSKISSLQGDIELARGEQASLRQAGATRDILAPLEGQITQMEAQQKVLGNQIASSGRLENELAALQRQAEILDLERSLAFDPLTRQIDELTNSMEEMPFDELLTKIKAEQANVALLTAKWDQANAAMKEQEAVVKLATEARDRIQESYDAEKLALDELGDAYDAVEDRISSMKSELNDMAAAAAAAREKLEDLSTVEQNFADAGLGDFDTPGGFEVPGEGGLLDIEDLTKDWQAELDKAFGNIDILAPLKKIYEDAKRWVKENFPEVGLAIIGAIALGIALGPLWGALLLVLIIFKDEAWKWCRDNFMSVGLAVILGILAGIAFWGLGWEAALAAGIGLILGKLLDFAANWARDHFGETGEEIIRTIGGAILRGPGPMILALIEVMIRLLSAAWNWVHEKFPEVGSKIIDLIMTGMWGMAGQLAGALNDILGNPIERAITWGVNKAITALNWLIDQINRLPGVDISHLGYVGGEDSFSAPNGGFNRPGLAAGGIPPVNLGKTGPFVTNGARAIVGEGSPSHPEFVIPTDPRFRGRAQGLYQQLGAKLFADGGIINKITDFAKARSQDARGLIFGPIHSGMNALINQIGSPIVEPPLHHANDALYDWLRGVKEEQSASGSYSGGGVLDSWLTQALELAQKPMSWLNGMRARAMQESGGDPNAINNWDSNAMAGTPSKGLMQMIDSTFQAYMVSGHGDIWNPVDNAASAARYIASRYGDPYSLPVGGYAAGGVLRAANGALIRATDGGSVIRAGEAGRDEAVVPLPRNMRSTDGLGLGNGSRTINFYGDLSFPNITDPDDAEDFIKNLETLAAS